MKQLKENKQFILILSSLMGVVVLLLGTTIFLWSKQGIAVKEDTKDRGEESWLKSESSEKIDEADELGGDLYIDIKGAVNHPGVYKGDNGTRVQDVVMMAGGYLPEADVDQVNQAARCDDQMVIYIPRKGEKLEEINESYSVGQKESEESGKGTININTATKEELTQLNGIGEKKAEAIIQHREEQGSFQKTEELKQVSGIGDKTYDALSDSISVK